MSARELRVLLVTPKNKPKLPRLLARQILWQCDMQQVGDYESALAKLTGNQFDLYFVDYHFARRSGLKLLRQAFDQGFNGAAILLLNTENPPVAQQALQMGVADYLVIEQLDAPLLERAIRYAVSRLDMLNKIQQSKQQHQKLVATEREQRRLAEALQDIAIALNSTLNFDELLERILINVERVVPNDTADIMLVEGDRARIARDRGYIEHGWPSVQDLHFSVKELPTLAHMVNTRQPLVIPQTLTSPLWTFLPKSKWIRSYVGAPIYLKDQVVGFLNLASAAPNFFNQAHAQHLQAFANHAAIAIGNIRRLEAERRQRELSETLHRATATLISALDLREVLDTLLIQLEQVIPYQSACVFLYQNEQLQAVAGRGFAAPEAVIGKAYSANDDLLFEEMRRTRQPVKIADAAQDSRFFGWGDTFYTRGWLGIPLIVRQHIIGTLTIDSKQVGAYDDVDMALVQTFANQAAIAIENAKLFAQTQEALVETETLYHISRTLINFEHLPDLLQIVTTKVSTALPATWVATVTLDFEAQQVTNMVVAGPQANITRTGSFDELMDGLTGWAIRHQKAALSPKGQPDPRESQAVRQNRLENHFGSIIVAPLLYKEKVLGAMTAINRLDEPDFTQRDVNLMMAMASQVAVTIENVSLFEAAKDARQLSDSLRELGASLAATLNFKELLERILAGLKNIVPFDTASIMLSEGNSAFRIREGWGIPRHSPVWGYLFYLEEQPILKEIVETCQPVVISNVRQDKRWVQFESGLQIGSWLGVPLIAGNRIVGILNLDRRQLNFYTQKHAAIASAFAQQAAIALENARLFNETRQRAEQLEALRQVTQDLTLLRDTKTLLRQIAKRALRLLGADAGGIHLYRPELDLLDGVVVLGKELSPMVPQLKPGQGLIGHVWATHKPVIINDYPNWAGHLSNWPHKIPDAALGVPIQWGDEYLGVLSVSVNNPHRQFTSDDASLLSQFAAQVAVAVENARLFDAANQRVAELEAVRLITLSLTSNLEFKALLEEILRSALRLITRADNAHIFLYQANQLIFGAALFNGAASNEPYSNPRPRGLTYTVAQTAQPIIVDDMRTHPLYTHAPPDWGGSIAGLPLKIGERVVGVMTIAGTQSNIWSESELNVLYLLADQAAVAIENARLYEQVQEYATQLEAKVAERTFRLKTLYDLAQALSHATQPGDVTRLTLLQLYQTVPHDVAASLLTIDITPTLVIQSRRRLSRAVEADIQWMLLKEYNQLTNQTISGDTLKIHRLKAKSEIKSKTALDKVASVLTTPIVMGNQVVGLLLVASQQVQQFTEEQEQLLNVVASQAAETIGRLQFLMAAEHKRLESLIAHLSSGVIMLDSNHHIVLANPAALNLISGLTQARVGDQLTHLGNYSISKILELATQEIPFVIEESQDSAQIFEITVQPIASGPDIGGWTLVIRDITEERAIQKRIQQQERVAAVGQLAAGIAHDFNNILTSIIGFAELLLLDPGLPASAKDDIERITKQGHRAAHLVRQILDFSRQTISSKQPLNLLPVIKETVKLLERTIPEDIHISLEIMPGEYTVFADLIQLQQALTNLAVNARDAMPNGGNLHFKLFQLAVSPVDEPPAPDLEAGDWVALSITDTGHGIPPELHGKIFEPFFTTKEVGEGTGLGLAQVYGIIKQHEGVIDVSSQPNAGTTFTLYFPARALAPGAMLAEGRSEIPRGHQEVVLLVEDNDSVRDITTAMLKRLNYQVITANNGVAALNLYRQHQQEIALVLTDMTMPEMGGAELTLTLRKIDPAVKVVVLTGYPLNSDAKEVLVEGVVDWLQKPVALEQLAQALNRTLSTVTEEVL